MLGKHSVRSIGAKNVIVVSGEIFCSKELLREKMMRYKRISQQEPDPLLLSPEATVTPISKYPIWKWDVSKWGILKSPISTSLNFKSWIKLIYDKGVPRLAGAPTQKLKLPRSIRSHRSETSNTPWQ